MAGPRGGGQPNHDDNRSNQLNPNHDAYWQSGGEDERPDDWDERSQGGDDD